MLRTGADVIYSIEMCDLIVKLLPVVLHSGGLGIFVVCFSLNHTACLACFLFLAPLKLESRPTDPV